MSTNRITDPQQLAQLVEVDLGRKFFVLMADCAVVIDTNEVKSIKLMSPAIAQGQLLTLTEAIKAYEHAADVLKKVRAGELWENGQ